MEAAWSLVATFAGKLGAHLGIILMLPECSSHTCLHAYNTMYLSLEDLGDCASAPWLATLSTVKGVQSLGSFHSLASLLRLQTKGLVSNICAEGFFIIHNCSLGTGLTPASHIQYLSKIGRSPVMTGPELKPAMCSYCAVPVQVLVLAEQLYKCFVTFLRGNRSCWLNLSLQKAPK